MNVRRHTCGKYIKGKNAMPCSDRPPRCRHCFNVYGRIAARRYRLKKKTQKGENGGLG